MTRNSALWAVCASLYHSPCYIVYLSAYLSRLHRPRYRLSWSPNQNRQPISAFLMRLFWMNEWNPLLLLLHTLSLSRVTWVPWVRHEEAENTGKHVSGLASLFCRVMVPREEFCWQKPLAVASAMPLHLSSLNWVISSKSFNFWVQPDVKL